MDHDTLFRAILCPRASQTRFSLSSTEDQKCWKGMCAKCSIFQPVNSIFRACSAEKKVVSLSSNGKENNTGTTLHMWKKVDAQGQERALATRAAVSQYQHFCAYLHLCAIYLSVDSLCCLHQETCSEPSCFLCWSRTRV
jgi:hypothetical protein